MTRTLGRLLRETDGQDLAEYGISLAVVALGAAGAAVVVATDVNTLWTRALQAIATITLSG